jgi:hypothetical protein
MTIKTWQERFDSDPNMMVITAMQAEIAELRARLDAWEKQEPVAWMHKWSFDGDSTAAQLHFKQDDCDKAAKSNGGVCLPLYTKPKEPS